MLLPLALWLLIYPVRLFIGHSRFATNAYDLSVFDYALWSTLTGALGHVPFLAHSLFSQHFMPTLLVLAPAYAAWPSPALLITIQIAAVVIAALLLARHASGTLPPLLAAALVFAFLFSRRSHSAIASVFYVESLEPALIFGFLLAWRARRWGWYWCLLVLALGCKEDMPVYIAAFGGLMWWRGERRAGVATVALAVAWLGVAVLVAVPAFREADGLTRTYPFVHDRLGGPDGGASVRVVAGRVFSMAAGERLLLLLASTGLFAMAAPAWILIPLPGILMNLAAAPEHNQAGLAGHYLWPVLPWLFWAAVEGAAIIHRQRRHLAIGAAVVLIAATAADSPLWRSIRRGFAVTAETASEMRRTIELIPRDAPVLASPNLVPHLPQRWSMHTFGVNDPPVEPEWVALTSRGDMWPLKAEDVERLERCYDDSHLFTRQSAAGAAVSVFRRSGSGSARACPAPTVQ